MAALALLAFLIRWIPAFFPHFWFDEIITTTMTQLPFGRITGVTAQHGAHPPLYYWWVKCFAALGRRLGGPFATLAWLRLASILPGVGACLLGWAAARWRWGRRPALWALALLALSPALTYYSVELRNYSSLHCLLLAGMIGLLAALEPGARHGWLGVLLFSAALAAALYMHALTALYLGAMGLIVLAELALRRAEWRVLAPRAAALLAPLLCYLPWLPIVRAQASRVNQSDLPFLPWAEWRDLLSTFFWFLPLGPQRTTLLGQGWPWAVMALFGAGLLALLIAARRRGAPRRPARAGADRLLLYSAALTVLPLLASFALSHLHLARTFLGYRYNLIPAPFFCLALVGLLLRLPRLPRRAALAGALALSAALSAVVLRQRVETFSPLQCIATWFEPAMLRPGVRFYWTSPLALPWLGRSGSIPIEDGEKRFLAAQRDPDGPGDVYLVSHGVLEWWFRNPAARLLEHVLQRRKVPQVASKGYWEGFTLWRLPARELAGVAEECQKLRHAADARRGSIPGGQVILADDPAFSQGDASGWGVLEFGEGTPGCWTEGPRQRLTWPGPARPGKYRVQVKFWRDHPFPEKQYVIGHRLPGEPAWRSSVFELGSVVLESVVEVTRPGQPLRLELATPTWVPSQRIPGVADQRPLGIRFLGIEVRPEA